MALAHFLALIPLTGNRRRRVHAAPSCVPGEHSSMAALAHFLALIGVAKSLLQFYQKLLVELKNLGGRLAHHFAVCSILWKNCQVNLECQQAPTQISTHTLTRVFKSLT